MHCWMLMQMFSSFTVHSIREFRQDLKRCNRPLIGWADDGNPSWGEDTANNKSIISQSRITDGKMRTNHCATNHHPLPPFLLGRWIHQGIWNLTSSQFTIFRRQYGSWWSEYLSDPTVWELSAMQTRFSWEEWFLHEDWIASVSEINWSTCPFNTSPINGNDDLSTFPSRSSLLMRNSTDGPPSCNRLFLGIVSAGEAYCQCCS